jgi:hypothetical protein
MRHLPPEVLANRVCPNIRAIRTGRRTGRLDFESEPAGPPAGLRHPEVWADPANRYQAIVLLIADTADIL